MENQKADVVLKQELGLYRRLHGPEYPQLRVQVAFSRSSIMRTRVLVGVGKCHGVTSYVDGDRPTH